MQQTQRITRHVDPGELEFIAERISRHFQTYCGFTKFSAIPKMLDIFHNATTEHVHRHQRRTQCPITYTLSIQRQRRRWNTSLPNVNELEWSFMPRTMS